MAARPEPAANPQMGENIVFWLRFRNELLDCITGAGRDENQFIQNFKVLEKPLERFKYVHEALAHYDLLDNKFREDVKDDRRARRNFRKGTNAFLKNKGSKSVRHYTYCIMKAKSPSVLADAYANRSAALLKFGLFEECIEDIDRALAHGYPEEKRTSLLARRKMAKTKCKNRIRPTFHEPLPHIPVNQRNPSIPGATRAVRLESNDKQRVRVLATKDIHPGQVIAIEECAGFSIFSEVLVYHCHNCYQLVYNPIPCLTCSQVVFCGEQCRDRACSTYHKHECPLMKTMKNCHDKHKAFLIAIRLTFSLASDQRPEMVQAIDTLRRGLDLPLLKDEMFTVTVMACLIHHLTKKHTTKFSGRPHQKDEDTFKDQLMANLLICFTNAALITEYHPDPDVAPGSILRMKYKCQTVATGLYPHLYSRFRHSCAPNVQKFHHGIKLVLRAFRTIKAGEECCISYGPLYEYQSREVRRKLMWDARHFRCDCKACLNDWVNEGGETYLLEHLSDAFAMKDIAPGGTDKARRYIDIFIQRIKEYEVTQPNANLTAVSNVAMYCHEMLGNKRELI